jgi:hypothetical protein
MATVLEGYTTEKQRYSVRFWGKKTQCKRYPKRDVSCLVGKCLLRLFGPLKSHLGSKSFVMTKWLKRRYGNGGDRSKKSSMLQVSTQW